jgi:hypothetical protein
MFKTLPNVLHLAIFLKDLCQVIKYGLHIKVHPWRLFELSNLKNSEVADPSCTIITSKKRHTSNRRTMNVFGRRFNLVMVLVLPVQSCFNV